MIGERTLREHLPAQGRSRTGARRAVPARLLRDRRRAAPRKRRRLRRATIPTATRERSTCLRRCKIPAGPARRGSVRRGARASLQPRLYSIASSPQGDAGRVALTVDAVRCASDERRAPRRRLDLLRRARRARRAARALCAEATASRCRRTRRPPIIMVGPGTGIAPFRAFLQRAAATQAPGRNWLFFGDQRSAPISSTRTSCTAMRRRAC